MISDEFGIETVSLERYMEDDYHRGKKLTKFLFEHFCQYVIIAQKLEEAQRIIDNGYQYTRLHSLWRKT